jgi:hypothetical protein
MTGWADDAIEEGQEGDGERNYSDGDVLGEVGRPLRARGSNLDEIP